MSKTHTSKSNVLFFHILAIVTVSIWGATFVSTKVLLHHGLSPVDIMVYRFALAYLCLLVISYRQLWARSFRDEMLFVGAALTGGSLYFLAENVALTYTYASNVSLVVCIAPLLTAIVVRVFYKKYRLSSRFFVGSGVAIMGVAMVVFNGQFVLRLSPLGDILALMAALLWAFYSLIIKLLADKYSNLFITRKIFFYSLVSLVPYYIVNPLQFDIEVLMMPAVMGNLLFLGIVASMLCFLSWNWVLVKLGTVRASNYIYLNPIVTLLVSAIVLSEPLMPISSLGAVVTLLGVYLADRNRPQE